MGGMLIVTGGSRGIGAAVARQAAAAGWAVAVNYRADRAAADRVVGAIRAAGGQAEAVAADVSDPEAVAALFREAEAALGPLRGLVNNAGILRRSARFVDIEPARWAEIFATNVTGSYLCAREAVRRLSTRSGGTGGAIVNLASVAARLGGAGEFVDYAASKGAIDALTLGLGREVAAEGIRVNAVRPGLIETDMQASSGDPDRATKLQDAIPMKRPGSADEVAAAVCWLLSDEASYVAGETLTVSGGR